MIRQGGYYSLVEVEWAAAASAVPEEVVAATVLVEMDMAAAVQGNIAVVDVASERRSLVAVVRSGQWAKYYAFC